jgi:hypothetical protein
MMDNVTELKPLKFYYEYLNEWSDEIGFFRVFLFTNENATHYNNWITLIALKKISSQPWYTRWIFDRIEYIKSIINNRECNQRTFNQIEKEGIVTVIGSFDWAEDGNTPLVTLYSDRLSPETKTKIIELVNRYSEMAKSLTNPKPGIKVKVVKYI